MELAMADGDPKTSLPKSNMRITDEDEQILIDMLSAYKMVRKAGKFVAVCVVGLLGFIVLVSQAWDAVKLRLGN
jgi:hypothetical protein